MSQQQPQRPVTFQDVFPATTGTLASQPVTKEDAALMQRTENLALGHTQKGGAAAAMQSAADHNVQVGAVPNIAQTSVANDGVTFGDVHSVIDSLETQSITQQAETLTLGHTQKGGTAAKMQSAADRNLQAGVVPDDTHRSLANSGVTYIGDAAPVTGAPATQPITKEDAALMQSAETRTLVHTQKGGTAARMQSSADKNMQAHAIPSGADELITYGDVNLCVSSTPPTQPITKEDAAHMQREETLVLGHTQKGGTAAKMKSAADKNAAMQDDTFPNTSVLGSADDEAVVTYGDILSVPGPLAAQPITKEDAAFMQHAETLTFGHTQKGGTAAAMQSAADQNMQRHVQRAPKEAGVTYGDVFPVEGALATQPITKEDAALMQRAETLALGHTQKGGAAATMQSAADYNVQKGAVPRDAHSSVAEEGVTVVATVLPKEAVRTQFVVAGQPISSALPAHMIPTIATNNSQDTVTIGEALEAAAMRAGDKPIDTSDASAIQSAEKRATRGIPTKPGGLAATTQAAAVLNPRVEDFSKTTLSDVLMDASIKLPRDKAVSWEDAEKVAEAELRNKQTSELRDGGVAAALVAAAQLNDKASLAPSSQLEQLKLQ